MYSILIEINQILCLLVLVILFSKSPARGQGSATPGHLSLQIHCSWNATMVSCFHALLASQA